KPKQCCPLVVEQLEDRSLASVTGLESLLKRWKESNLESPLVLEVTFCKLTGRRLCGATVSSMEKTTMSINHRLRPAENSHAAVALAPTPHGRAGQDSYASAWWPCP